MHYATLTLAALASLATAQKTHVVLVGMNTTLTYSPDSITAAVGDQIQFQFLAGNHTATMSTFDQPCQPISQHSTNVTGFHSGFQPAAASSAMGMTSTYTVTVNNTTPVWVYCAQGKHCASGMVMAINVNTSSNKTLAAFKSLAASAQTVVPSGSSSGGTSSSTSTTTTTGSGTNATPSGSFATSLSAPSTLGFLAGVFALFML